MNRVCTVWDAYMKHCSLWPRAFSIMKFILSNLHSTFIMLKFSVVNIDILYLLRFSRALLATATQSGRNDCHHKFVEIHVSLAKMWLCWTCCILNLNYDIQHTQIQVLITEIFTVKRIHKIIISQPIYLHVHVSIHIKQEFYMIQKFVLYYT